jgi:hypothetical protein
MRDYLCANPVASLLVSGSLEIIPLVLVNDFGSGDQSVCSAQGLINCEAKRNAERKE